LLLFRTLRGHRAEEVPNMRAHRTLVTVGLAASAVCFTSFAKADDQPAKSDRVDTQPSGGQAAPATPETTPTNSPDCPPGMRPKTQQPVTVTPPAAPPPVTQTTVSTTKTTSAEYNEMAGAEREKTVLPNRPLLGTGAIVFGAPYVASVIVGAVSTLDADDKLFIPVVGPWLDLGQRPCGFGSSCSTSNNVESAFLVADGIAQGAGVLMMLGSLVVPEHRTETVTTTTGKALPPPPAKSEVHIMPVSYLGGGGIGASGKF
jgi:hypothetical protein